MNSTELRTASREAAELGIDAWARRIGGQQVLEIKTPSGTLRKFFCFNGWDVYRRGVLDKKRRVVTHV